MSDEYAKYPKTIDSVIEHAFAITPDDNADLPKATRSIYVGETGDLEVTMVSDETVVFTNVPAGSVLPLRVKRVLAANTTADGLVGLL